MTLKLHLGVVDVPYANGDKTTGDVATILEDRYHVIEFFAEDVGAGAIEDAFAHSARSAVEAIVMGAPASLSLTAEATSELETAFRTFLDQQEMDGHVPGVPTKASLRGVNHRKKRAYVKRNGPRPSFVDTGLYRTSFKAWTD